jgi:hypothetical protein
MDALDVQINDLIQNKGAGSGKERGRRTSRKAVQAATLYQAYRGKDIITIES